MRFSKRVTLRRRHSYNTLSNKVAVVKTPGARLTVHYLKKRASVPKCGICKHNLHGIPAMTVSENRAAHACERTVARAYGGSLCHHCVRDKIMRAFLVEEQKQAQKAVSKKLTKVVKAKTTKKTTKKTAKKSAKTTKKSTKH